MPNNVKIGDTIALGHYPQGANGEICPITWQVLDIKDNKALIMSRYGLDAQSFNKEWINITWETCTLRAWLNHDFYTKAFNPEEQERILDTLVTADKNPDYDTDQGHDTQDKVFLLSIKEVKQYFKNDNERAAKGTNYCFKQGAYEDFNGLCFWWLRSSGDSGYGAADILSDGSVDACGNYVDDSQAVRPALILKL